MLELCVYREKDRQEIADAYKNGRNGRKNLSVVQKKKEKNGNKQHNYSFIGSSAWRYVNAKEKKRSRRKRSYSKELRVPLFYFCEKRI